MAVYTTTQLITEVRRRAMLPNSQSNGSLDADILAAADAEIETRLYPLVMKLQEEYFLSEITLPLTDGVALNQSDVRIPQDAYCNKLRDVLFQVNNGSWSNVPRLNLEDEYLYKTQSASQIPLGFVLFNDHIRLLPRGSYGQGRLILRYFRRPFQLGGTVETYSVSQLFPTSQPGAANGDFNLTLAPQTPLVGGAYVFFMAEPPFEYIGYATNLIAGTASVSVTLRFAGNLSMLQGVACVRVGPANTTQWPVLPNGTDAVVSPFIQLPGAYSQLLVQRTVCRMLQSQRDQQGLAIAEADAAAMEAALVAVTGDRVDGEPKRVRGGLIRNIQRTGYTYDV